MNQRRTVTKVGLIFLLLIIFRDEASLCQLYYRMPPGRDPSINSVTIFNITNIAKIVKIVISCQNCLHFSKLSTIVNITNKDCSKLHHIYCFQIFIGNEKFRKTFGKLREKWGTDEQQSGKIPQIFEHTLGRSLIFAQYLKCSAIISTNLRKKTGNGP